MFFGRRYRVYLRIVSLVSPETLATTYFEPALGISKPIVFKLDMGHRRYWLCCAFTHVLSTRLQLAVLIYLRALCHWRTQLVLPLKK